uniref:Uncharacterized protein n=1 Tax=Ignisphaera aggregans TaxID=334771 RepID=A0A7C5TJN7_9CREN
MELKHYKELIDKLDLLASITAMFGTTLSYVDITSLASRYYVSVHDVLLPVAIEDKLNLTYKAFLEPIANIYLHEHKVYAIIKNSKESYFLDNTQWNRISVIDLMQNEKFTAIAAASIAEKMYLLPTERGIARILPSNLKTYVDTAYNMIKRIKDDYHDIIQQIENKHLYLSSSKKPIEIVLWLKKASTDNIKEISYVKGVSLRAFKVSFIDYEIEIKIYRIESVIEAIRALEKFITSNVLVSISKNIERAIKILIIAINIIS